MVGIIFSCVFALFAILLLMGVLSTVFRRKDAKRAVERFRKNLGKEIARGYGKAEVNPISFRPLTIEMAKEVASMSGYEFVGFFNRNGSELLQFRSWSHSRSGE